MRQLFLRDYKNEWGRSRVYASMFIQTIEDKVILIHEGM